MGKTEDEVSPLNTFSEIDLVSNDITRAADMLFPPVSGQNASK